MMMIDPEMSAPYDDYTIKRIEHPTEAPDDMPVQRCRVERTSTLVLLVTQGLSDSFPYAILGCFMAPIDLTSVDEDPAGYLMA